MRRFLPLATMLLLGSASLAAAVAVGASPALAAASCHTVSTSHGSLTAAVVNPSSTVSGAVTPTGCDIGVYFGPGTSGTVNGATISGFVEYGVYNDGGTVTVEDSTISNIGDTPFDGVQYGIGVYFVNPNLVDSSESTSSASGIISGNTISQYQKGGITVNGSGSTATVTDNTVTGLGPVSFIAQNGIQFGFGATVDVGAVSGNTISGNIYTEGDAPPGYVSTGFLFYETNVVGQDVGPIVSSNHVFDNQANIAF
jgi:parallel beta-helix repeat protein